MDDDIVAIIIYLWYSKFIIQFNELRYHTWHCQRLSDPIYSNIQRGRTKPWPGLGTVGWTDGAAGQPEHHPRTVAGCLLSPPLCQSNNMGLSWVDGGGGVQGVWLPLFGPCCRPFNIGPKVGLPPGPPFLACRPKNKMDPLIKNPGFTLCYTPFVKEDKINLPPGGGW